MSRQIYFTARDMLLLRDDKNDLIDALARSKADSDKARDRAESASRAKSDFLANMSHELRTPLNAILGFSEMIYSNPTGAQAVRNQEYAKLVHQSGSHLLALIDDILDLSRIEAGKFQLRVNDVDLACLIGDAVQLMAPKAELARLALATEVAGELPILHADQRAIWQILLNLLANAVKFTPAGGSVFVFARIEASGDVAFGVRDTGVGIAPEDQLLVFETFGQGRHDVATPDKGMGLGLSIVKGITEAHGGRVELSSHLGRGTSVTIVLPASRAKPRLRQAS
jgi:two-component system cell cycle sensor histidine kinase PleC